MRQGYADQGTERHIWTCPNIFAMGQTSQIIDRLASGDLQLDDVDAENGMMWPKVWDTPGHLHMLFGALKKGCLAMPQWKDLEAGFRGLGNFMGKRGLRKRFVSKCIQDRVANAAMFSKWTGGNFSWRWEKLYVFLFQLRPRIKILIEAWDPDFMSKQERDHDDDEESKGIQRRVTVALAIPGLPILIELLWVKVRSVYIEGRWLEGCRCHSKLHRGNHECLPDNRSEKHEGSDRCPWKGRRAVELAMGHAEKSRRMLVEATSDVGSHAEHVR